MGDKDELTSILEAIPEGVTSLDLAANGLFKKTENLSKILKAIPTWVTSLNFSENPFSINIEEIAAGFNALHENLETIHLCTMGFFSKVTHTKLNLLKDSLRQVQTVYLSYNEVIQMSEEQRKAVEAIFPNAQLIIFLDKMGNEMGQSKLDKFNIARVLGFDLPFPSLLKLSLFCVKDSQIDIQNAAIPDELKQIRLI